ncbi:MAG TPA: extracellular solute-binding protein [Clostridiaceae bacterium]|nr:extracellular solute-binding protein [Clostridiaceae bacterium]
MKKIIALLLTIVMVFSLAACGKPTPNTKTPSPSPGDATQGAIPTEPVTLKFANYAILETGYEDFWNGVKEDFEKKYENITIEWVTAPYGEIVNQVINMAGGGDKVDILFGEIGWTPVFEDAGLSVPVDTILSEEFLDDFYPAMLEACSINGRPYALPMYVSPFVLYYNKDLFTKAGLDPEKPPKTYDEMLDMAEKLSKLKTADGNKVYAFGQTTASVPISGAALTAMVYNFGGRVLTDDGELDADSKAFKQTFEMIKLLDEKGYNPQNAKLKDLRNLFALGQLAMYYDQSWGYNGASTINPDIKNFTASAPPLAGGDGSGESILQAATLVLMDNGTAQKQALRLLVEYLVSAEVLNDFLAITPAYPARQSMKDLEVITKSEILKGAKDSLDKTMPSAFVPTLNDINLELCTLAQSVTVGGKSVEQGIADFKTAAQALLE